MEQEYNSNSLVSAFSELIKSALRSSKDFNELEFKFHATDSKGKVGPSMSKTVSLYEELERREYEKTTSSYTSSIFDNGIRKISIPGQEDVWQEKERVIQNINGEYHLGYPIKISLSNEIDASMYHDGMVPSMVRKITRSSYTIICYMIRIDLSIVTLDSGEDIYETEIEVLNLDRWEESEVIEKWLKGVEYIYKLFLGTDHTYTESERRSLNSFVNRSMLSNRSNISKRIIDNNLFIDKMIFPEARTMRSTDLSQGEIVGSKTTGVMAVSYKADGIRTTLIINEVGVWLVSYKQTNLIHRGKLDGVPSGTFIFDGELIPAQNSKIDYGTKRLYVFIDSLMFKGVDVREYPLLDRLKVSKNMEKILTNHRFNLGQFITKPSYLLPDSVEFYSIVNCMLTDKDYQVYLTDGLIFTPANSSYTITHPRDRSLYDRKLSKYPDIVKFKPVDTLTIDFRVRVDKDNKVSLYVVNQESTSSPQEEVLFKGTVNVPFDQSTMIGQGDKTQVLVKDGYIVEYKWVPNQGDRRTGLMIPVRNRTDKPTPNRLDVSMNNWHSNMFPVTTEDISGTGDGLSKRYHNRIKSNLFSELNSIKSNGLHMDIGTGRGGDINKFRKFEHVVAVEPNSEHIKELKERLQKQGMSDMVTIIQAGGEDTDLIRKGIVDTLGDVEFDSISMMNSLTFFWKDYDMVKRLHNTITQNLKIGGSFVWMVMDGDSVMNMMEPKFSPFGSPLPIKHRLELGSITIQKKETPREIEINIPMSIVGTQTEYLTRVTDISLGFSRTKEGRADRETFLPQSMVEYSKLFIYGLWTLVEKKSLIMKNKVTNKNTTGPRAPTKVKGKGLSTSKSTSTNAGPRAPTKVKGKGLSTSKSTSTNTKPRAPTKVKGKGLSTSKPQIVEFHRKEKDVRSMLEPGEIREYYKKGLKDHKMVRIGSIGDGHCLYHSVLYAIDESYRKGWSVEEQKRKTSEARKLRRECAKYYASTLEGEPDPIMNSTLVQYYLQLNNLINIKSATARKFKGSTAEQLEKHKRELIVKLPEDEDDRSPLGIWSNINSSKDSGHETIDLLSKIFNINICVMSEGLNGFMAHGITLQDANRPFIFILHIGNHYETVAVLNVDRDYQTAFSIDHPFVRDVIEGEYNATIIADYDRHNIMYEELCSIGGHFDPALYDIMDLQSYDIQCRGLKNPIMELLWLYNHFKEEYIDNENMVELPDTILPENHYTEKGKQLIAEVRERYRFSPARANILSRLIALKYAVFICRGDSFETTEMKKINELYLRCSGIWALFGGDKLKSKSSLLNMVISACETCEKVMLEYGYDSEPELGTLCDRKLIDFMSMYILAGKAESCSFARGCKNLDMRDKSLDIRTKKIEQLYETLIAQ